MSEDKTALMGEMIARLNAAAAAYYDGRGEMMTDYEWDALLDELRRLEQETGVVLPASPTHRVGADTTAGERVAHEYPALSLAKTKRPEELAQWAGGRPVWLSWKLDGLTLVATWDDGRLTRVVTRGNGHEGTDITRLATAIEGLPATLPLAGHIVVRGEAVISYHDFELYNLENDSDYANPRNLASGSLTLKDADEVRRRHIRWMPFTLVHTDDDITSWGQRMERLAAAGLLTVDRERIEQPTEDNIRQVIDRWTHRVESGQCPYPVDGLVITYDDTLWASGGSVTGHHATRAGYAFKWADEEGETTLRQIEWSCAASTISPVAVFEPVELEGTTVRRASLCNISECERLGIGAAGTRLAVIKANKIIPKVVRVTRREGQLDIPARCPVCGAPTVVTVSPQSGTRTLHCTSPDCPAKQLRKYERFVSKAGMDIDGISGQTLSRLINLGWLSEWADIYHLADHQLELSRLEGFGPKSAANMVAAVEKSRHCTARRLLYALAIPLVGTDVCKRLLTSYTLADLIAQARAAESEEHFAHIAGIGPEKSAALVRWMREETTYRRLQRLLAELQVADETLTPQGNRCEGLTFCVTGDVHHYKNRSELKAYIESQGGKVSGSVSRATAYLINNDTQSASAKNQKAKALGVRILGEEEFIAQFVK